MARILTVYACTMVAALLSSGDANACHRRHGGCGASTDNCCGTSYGGHGTAYGANGTGTYYGTGGTYGTGAVDLGRPGTNPGGIGGPASGLGVRPGAGVGGFGPRR